MEDLGKMAKLPRALYARGRKSYNAWREMMRAAAGGGSCKA